jgi:hypothetical protein
MPKYLTTQQYRDLDAGTSLADINDFTLARLIARAETAVDAHMGFDLAYGGFEPHPVWVQCAYDMQSRKITYAGIVPVQVINRYRIQISNQGDGSGFFATIRPQDCVINQGDKYIEIVPFQAITFDITPFLFQFGLNPPIMQMDSFVCFYTPFFNDALYNTGDNRAYRALRGFWASTYIQATYLQPFQIPQVPPIVYVDGIIATDYTIDYTEGAITFDEAQSANAKVTADYTAQIPDTVREATIRQVTYILEQRALKKTGMGSIMRARNADQEIQLFSKGDGQIVVLCEEAAKCLVNYEEIAIA